MRFILLFLLVLPFIVFANSIILDDGTEVIAVADVADRTMSIELFDGGPMTREQRLIYMPDGKAPASVNVFLVKTGGKTYLIDAGFGNAIKDKRIDVSKINGIFLTHAHADNIYGLLNADGKAVFSAPLFVTKKEMIYWHNPITPNAELTMNTAKTYAPFHKFFNFGDTIVHGIAAIDASGHTPGHTAFLIGTGKKKILIAGDFLQAAALQFPHPEESIQFDIDKKKAAETRKRLMKMAEDNDWIIAGTHIAMPGFGKVKSNGKGGFEFFYE